MKHTLSALVRNEPGVLAHMARHFGEAKLNINSIACGETENPDISRMVIRIEANPERISRITERMQALDVVIQVDDLSRKEFVDRELALIKVALTPEDTAQIMQIFEVFRADVVGMGQRSVTVELTGDEARVDGLIKMLKPYGILSMCRTGTIALKRGDE
ncbi:acetolactate synthase, small subunit [Paucidesulfovibrio gracilis DSM 16080]|uniref:Acetolactate synthase small subunit n=1 Tax=Paucidesulfovibrio gracilis DSM 16080 TaxID=1121449 RepID=A0A1T4WLS1_9BACT|nr:acetolactate synthase small subunit [Paucidesulfovibrio gracilis]SKA78097.1 acetolactate synthase, small subunit [Paucidesulfovibrio gracilis DSM 16080]